MDKQSALYFLVLIAVVGVSGYLFNNKLQAETPDDLFIDTVNISHTTSATASLSNDTKEAVKKISETKTNKIMQNSDVTKLDIEVTGQGTGSTLSKPGDVLSMNYTGMLLDGTKFDSNVDPKFGHVQPFEFRLGAGMVIKGWDQGLVGMKVGEKRRLTIPADMAYGSRGAGASIPPNSALIFDVELLNIK